MKGLKALNMVLGNKGSIGSEIEKKLRESVNADENVVGLDFKDFDLSRNDLYERYFSSLVKVEKYEKINVFNATGIMGAKESVEDPGKYFISNGVNPFKIFKYFAKFENLNKFIQLSSETVYGETKEGASQNEDDEIFEPRHEYGYSKLIAEKLLISESILQKNRVLIYRCPVVILKNQKYPNTFSHLLNEMELNNQATIFGDGSHIRRYTLIDWLVSDIISMVAKDNSIVPHLINGYGLKLSSNEIVEGFEYHSRKKIFKTYVPNANTSFSLFTHSKYNLEFLCGYSEADRSFIKLIDYARGQING